MPRHGDSFNDTLRTWGVGGGAYLVLPLFGPSDYRGLAALPVNSMASASSQISDTGAATGLTVIGVIDKRASLLDATKLSAWRLGRWPTMTMSPLAMTASPLDMCSAVASSCSRWAS